MTSVAAASTGRVETVSHELTRADTLTGLAIRYGSTPEGIIRASGLLGGDLDLLPVGTVLTVPISTVASPIATQVAGLPDADDEARLRNLAVRAFCDRHGCPAAEASYYLSEHKWSVDAASRHFDDDRRWEATRAKGSDLDARVPKQLKRLPEFERVAKPRSFVRWLFGGC